MRVRRFVLLATLVALAVPALGSAAGDLEARGAHRPSNSLTAMTCTDAGRTGFEAWTPEAPATLGAPAPVLAADGLLAQSTTPEAPSPAIAEVFTAERARILLRSLTVPGWGQATAGRSTAAKVFGILEAGIWGSFTAFRIQEQLRRDNYERSARLLAGIDLRGRDEEFRRIVGSYLSSEQYNQYVVFRDAANLYLSDPDDPDYAGYRAYIAEHELRGDNTWSWQTEDDLLRYRGQRKDAQRAGIRANTTLALAVIHRLVSAVDAARGIHSKSGQEGAKQSWNLEVAPTDLADATAFRIGVRTRF